MNGRASKNKGMAFQKIVRNAILTIFKDLIPNHEDVGSTTAGVNGMDIKLSPYAQQHLPLAIECKSLKVAAIYKTYDQAVAHVPEGSNLEPCVIMKINRRKPIAVVDMQYFLELMAYKARKENEE